MLKLPSVKIVSCEHQTAAVECYLESRLLGLGFKYHWAVLVLGCVVRLLLIDLP